MAYIEKREGKTSVRFRAQVRLAGFKQVDATFASKRAAKAWAAQKEADMLAGRYQSDELARQHTAGELVDRYIEERLFQKSEKTEWVTRQKQQLLWWKDQIGKYRLINLNQFVLCEARDELADDRKGSTVNRYLSTLNHALVVARDQWNWILSNPLDKVERPKEPGYRVRFLSPDELERLLDACARVSRDSGKPLDIIVILALSTGARKNTELLSLRPRHVMFDQHKLLLENTKNGQQRTAALYGLAFDRLAEWMEDLPSYCRFVFSNARGDKPMWISREWRQALKIAKIENYRFHDNRHTFASYLAMDGAKEATLAEALGHKEHAMAKRYTHLAEDHTHALVAAMNQKLFQPFNHGV